MERELPSFDRAQAVVLEAVEPLGGERVPIHAAARRFLAEDAVAAVDLPPFASSAMDGYAVRAADLPGRLEVVAEAAAGSPAARPVASGEAIAISTGAVVPEGADVVVPVEYVVENGNWIEVAEGVQQGAHVRAAGSDVLCGDVVGRRGHRLTPARVGALGAAGVVDVPCGRRPTVAVIATGSELVTPGDDLGPGAVYEANTAMLAGAAEDAGATVQQLGPVRDSADEHRSALSRGLEADVLVTSGGVSVGRHDLVRRIEAELGVEERFWGVAVKPGKPVTFGVRGRTLVFGLPGNPVSALVGFELFVRPALLALQGADKPLPRWLPGRLAIAVRRNAGRDQLIRARTQTDGDEVVVSPLQGQDSHMIARAGAADALALVPRGTGDVQEGSAIRYLQLL